jgi:hypothetical protein
VQVKVPRTWSVRQANTFADRVYRRNSRPFFSRRISPMIWAVDDAKAFAVAECATAERSMK